MLYKLLRGVKDGKIASLSLGVPEVDSYLDFIKHRCRLNTWVNYGYDLQVFLNAIQKPLVTVTPADIFVFIRQQREVAVRNRRREGLIPLSTGLSSRTIQRRLAAISGLYAYLLTRGDTILKTNPVPRGLPVRSEFRSNSQGLTPLLKVPQILPRPLDDDEIHRFLSSLRTQRDRAMMLLMLMGGLRRSEVLGLTLEDLDFGQRTVLVREGKGGHQRLVPVSNVALAAIIQYLNEERPVSPSPKVFLALKGLRRGQPLKVAALDTIISYHRSKAGTPGVQCHRLRHTCFTRLRQAGMSLEALQAQAGHRSILSTRIYLHLCLKELHDEYLRVSDQLFIPQNGTEVTHV
jgi:integrase